MRYVERDHKKRIEYLRTLRRIISGSGSSGIVYLDESGFERTSHRTHGWGPSGKKVNGERSGKKHPRTSLVCARQGRKLLAPMLFEGSADSPLFNFWMENFLFKELAPGSTIIMDNAAFHKTALTKQIIEDAGHDLLFLPPYSPDFNPIENDFANIRRRRQFMPDDTSIYDVIDSYVSYLD
jgi:hypothetical protein